MFLNKYDISGCVHIGFFWPTPVTQILEVALATQALEDFVLSVSSGDDVVPHVLCGDFNIEPHFPAYRMLSNGCLSEEDKERLKRFDYIRWPAYKKVPNEVHVAIN